MWQYRTCSHKSDIWAVGCVIYELLALSPPFKEPGLKSKVCNAVPPELPESYSASMRDTVIRMLWKNPSHRPSSTELLQDAFIAHQVQRWLAAGHSSLGHEDLDL